MSDDGVHGWSPRVETTPVLRHTPVDGLGRRRWCHGAGTLQDGRSTSPREPVLDGQDHSGNPPPYTSDVVRPLKLVPDPKPTPTLAVPTPGGAMTSTSNPGQDRVRRHCSRRVPGRGGTGLRVSALTHIPRRPVFWSCWRPLVRAPRVPRRPPSTRLYLGIPGVAFLRVILVGTFHYRGETVGGGDWGLTSPGCSLPGTRLRPLC